jgi:hypothetical protein
VLLFIDRLPFHWWMPNTGTAKYWSVSVPALVTERDSRLSPAPAYFQPWRIDTGCSGDTFAWRGHLLEAGLDPRRKIVRSTRAVLGGGSVREELLIRSGDLWLYSNIPALHGQPYRLPLHPGITFVNREIRGDPRYATPAVGMQAQRRAGVRIELDFVNDTLSLWVPSPFLRRVSTSVRRWLSFGRRIPIAWRD